MYDVIGKRRYFFAFSLAITIPGLIFILLGFPTGGKVGLQFAIDFTGGTVWTIRFEDPNVTPARVREIIEAEGYEAAVTKTGEGFMEIRTKEAALAAPAPSPTPVPTPTPAPSAAASASTAPSASGGPSPSGSPSVSAAPSCLGIARPVRLRGRRAGSGSVGTHDTRCKPADRGQAR